jgi:hypothetical protein
MKEQITSQESINNLAIQLFQDLESYFMNSERFIRYNDEDDSMSPEEKKNPNRTIEMANNPNKYIKLWFSGRGDLINYVCEEVIDLERISTTINFNSNINQLEIKQKIEIMKDEFTTIGNENYKSICYKNEEILIGIEKVKEVINLQTGSNL